MLDFLATTVALARRVSWAHTSLMWGLRRALYVVRIPTQRASLQQSVASNAPTIRILSQGARGQGLVLAIKDTAGRDASSILHRTREVRAR